MLQDLGFDFAPKPYTLFFAQKNKLSVAVYEKGPKVLVQGKGIEEFVQFELEPKILEQAKLGYEEVHSPEMFEPHFGIDESGKGDFFGPLVIAGVYVDAPVARKFLEAGIQDSKRIGSDARIRALAKIIKTTPGSAVDIVAIGPERYNDLYEKFGNLNSLLGWGHARVIENLLARKPECPRALSDKFADARVIERALLQHGQKIQLGATDKSRIRPGRRGGFHPGAGSFHRLAGPAREGDEREAWAWRFGAGKGGGEEAGGGRGARSPAQGRQGAFSHRPRDCAWELRGAAPPARMAQVGSFSPAGKVPAIYFLLPEAHLWKPGS